MGQSEEKIRWAVTAYKGGGAQVLEQIGPELREEAMRRIEAERERGFEIRHERAARIAQQLGPGEVSRGLYVE